ncbi:hypothetical protein KIN20_038464 [Parelaphostrongylus tenuis]|uniref:Uncharacterized protein n=1 Tax=Parelaphostrongylus tenuis TaxID=148309 RepID=A0AAD5RCY6_PARTN|nr:hypothetical protein KIN20_038464 [Parelaphostrongylus tenuis]
MVTIIPMKSSSPVNEITFLFVPPNRREPSATSLVRIYPKVMDNLESLERSVELSTSCAMQSTSNQCTTCARYAHIAIYFSYADSDFICIVQDAKVHSTKAMVG